MSENQSFKGEGIMGKGYGFIPKTIMKDKDLTIEAKAIYAYLSSYTGAGNTAYPSISLMCGDLDISERRFYKHRKLLIEKGYIVIEKKRNEGGWLNNIYKLPFKPYPQNVSIQNVSTQNVSIQNVGTKSNSIKSNSIKSNSSSSSDDHPLISKDLKRLMNLFESGGFGPLNSYVGERISSLMEDYQTYWVEDAMKVAIDSNVRKLTYVESILKRWQAEGKGNQKKKADDPYAGMEVY